MTFGAVTGVLLATLHAGGHSTSNEWSFNLASGDAALAELIQNLILFIPLGIGLAWCGVPLLYATAIGALLSFSVEFAQQWIPGRDPNVGDILCNTISTAIGVTLVRLSPHWLTVSPQRSGVQALGAAGLAIVVWFGTAALLSPTFGPPPYTVTPRPDFNFWGLYQGAVLESRLESGLLYVKATFPDRPPGRPSPLAAVVDGNGKLATVFAVAGRDLSMRYDMPSLRLTLEQPDLRWEDALAKVAPADTFMATTGREKNDLCIAVIPEYRCGLGYTIGDGWKLIYYPQGRPAWMLGLINLLWMMGCVIGVGFWGARSRGGENGAGGIALTIVIVGVLMVPLVTGLNATPVHEWFGALAGLGLGYLVARRS